MVDQALPSSSPIAHPPSTQSAHATQHAIPAAKSAANASDGKASRQQKLRSHLLIGFLMVIFAIAGYTLIGPHSHVNAAGSAGNRMINISSTSTSSAPNPAGYANQTANELAAMQVEMDAITRQINAVKAGMVPAGNSSSGAFSLNNTGSVDPTKSQMNQMSAMMNNLMNQMNKMNPQMNAQNSPSNNSGHGHH